MSKDRLDRDVALHAASEVATDGEAESSTFSLSCVGHIRLDKRVEDQFLLLRQDSLTRVCYANLGCAVIFSD